MGGPAGRGRPGRLTIDETRFTATTRMSGALASHLSCAEQASHEAARDDRRRVVGAAVRSYAANGFEYDTSVPPPMHLSGHYSNPPEALETALAALSEGVVRERRRESAALVPAPRRLGNGELQSGVIRILEAADRPLRVGEVRLAVERCLRKPVSASSVNACLSVGARRAGRFERVGAGLYRLTRDV